jgi:hypothetical protein
MDNFRRGLRSQGRADAKTGLAVFLVSSSIKTSLMKLLHLWGRLQKACVSFFKVAHSFPRAAGFQWNKNFVYVLHSATAHHPYSPHHTSVLLEKSKMNLLPSSQNSLRSWYSF